MNRHLRLVDPPAPRKRPAQLTFGFGVPDPARTSTQWSSASGHTAVTAAANDTVDRLEAIRLKLIKRGGVG